MSAPIRPPCPTRSVRRYLDHAASSPLRESARAAWIEASTACNPGSQYRSGREANARLSEARETVAELLDCEPIEVIFTASGTESNNFAVAGFAGRGSSPGRKAVVATSPIEHPSVAESTKRWGRRLFDVDPLGRVTVESMREAIDEDVSLATCMMGNNETGVIQPVDELVTIAAEFGVPVHVDAVQAVGHVPVSFSELGAHSLSASAHKFGGPHGSGLWLVKRSPAPSPLTVGGGQQRGLRPGTIDVASAVATSVALREAIHEMEDQDRRIRGLRRRLAAALTAAIPDCVIHGDVDESERLPGHLFMSFPGAESDSLMFLADTAAIECSPGSACSSGVNRASEVLLAMGVSESVARCTTRFSLGRTTTDEDVDAVIALFPGIVEQARRAGMAY